MSYQHWNTIGGHFLMLSVWKLYYLPMSLAGSVTGVCHGCWSLSWGIVPLVSTWKAGNRGTGGRGSSRPATWAVQGHRYHWAASRSGRIAVLWMGHWNRNMRNMLQSYDAFHGEQLKEKNLWGLVCWCSAEQAWAALWCLENAEVGRETTSQSSDFHVFPLTINTCSDCPWDSHRKIYKMANKKEKKSSPKPTALWRTPGQRTDPDQTTPASTDASPPPKLLAVLPAD